MCRRDDFPPYDPPLYEGPRCESCGGDHHAKLVVRLDTKLARAMAETPDGPGFAKRLLARLRRDEEREAAEAIDRLADETHAGQFGGWESPEMPGPGYDAQTRRR